MNVSELLQKASELTIRFGNRNGAIAIEGRFQTDAGAQGSECLALYDGKELGVSGADADTLVAAGATDER